MSGQGRKLGMQKERSIKIVGQASEASEASSHPAFMKVGLGSELEDGKWVLFGMKALDAAAAEERTG